jgi:hypothetical protein
MGCPHNCHISCTVDAAASAAGSGAVFGGDCGTTVNSVDAINIVVTPNAGYSFTSWYCRNVATGATLLNGGNANETLDSTLYLSININCFATLGVAPAPVPAPVPASVESGLALVLTFLGILTIVGFRKWRA